MKTVQVSKRGCGLPKEGGFYAMGGGKAMTCYALPVELKPCVCCYQQPKFARCPTKVTSEYLHQMFAQCEKTENCRQCVRDQDYWISWIGSDYDAESFSREVQAQGMSRRIPPSLVKLIKPGDIFANVKGGKIFSLVPVTSIRYYAKKKDDPDKIAALEKDGIEVCNMEIVDQPTQMSLQ